MATASLHSLSRFLLDRVSVLAYVSCETFSVGNSMKPHKSPLPEQRHNEPPSPDRLNNYNKHKTWKRNLSPR